MAAEPAGLWIPEWNSSPATLESFEEDVLIFLHSTPEDKRATCGPKLLSKFKIASAERSIGLSLLKAGELQKTNGCENLLKVIRTTLGKELEQDVSEHYQRYLHRGARRYCQSVQSYIAEEAALYDRALKAVKTVEPETTYAFSSFTTRLSVIGVLLTDRQRTSTHLSKFGEKLQVRRYCEGSTRSLGQRSTSTCT